MVPVYARANPWNRRYGPGRRPSAGRLARPQSCPPPPVSGALTVRQPLSAHVENLRTGNAIGTRNHDYLELAIESNDKAGYHPGRPRVQPG